MFTRPLVTSCGTLRRLAPVALLFASALLPGRVIAGLEPVQQQVFAAERAFAQSMADRSLEAFSTFVADEAIFFGPPEPLRGKAAVVAGWQRFFEGETAPFSWEPDRVEVLSSGTLALSTGLVKDPDGRVIARFNSIWRLDVATGSWRVVFDKGSPPDPGDLPEKAE